MQNKLLAFNISAQFGHFKVIYATTTALTYPLPSKTAIYGLVANIIGLSKYENVYLKEFSEGQCKIALQILNPISTQRLHINWSAAPGPIKDRKPTLVEHLSNPSYRIFFTHKNEKVYNSLKHHLETHTSVYTPCMGLANLLANFSYSGEFSYSEMTNDISDIHTIIPMSVFESFDYNSNFERENFITQMSQYAMEMTPERDVTKREEVLFDRNGIPIRAKVKGYQVVDFNNEKLNLILF